MPSGDVTESCRRWACRCHPRMFVELQVVSKKEWVLEWCPYLERIWTVSRDWVCMRNGMESVSERIRAVTVLEFEWITKWLPCLECICIVSESEIWISDRRASVSGASLSCRKRLNEWHNGFRVWSVYGLYQELKSEWVSEWLPCLEHIRTVSESWIIGAGRVDICPVWF